VARLSPAPGRADSSGRVQPGPSRA
jgi:hypothetical protein